MARTSKHILLFAIDLLSLNSLSLIEYCIILFILYICLGLIVCHTCVKPREFYIAPQLLEEIVQNPSSGIRLHSLITLSVLQFSFNSTSFVIRLALHLFTPSLGVLSDRCVGSDLMRLASHCMRPASQLKEIHVS